MGGRNNVHVCLRPCHRHALHFTDDTCHSSTERMRMASHQGQIRVGELLFAYVHLFYFHSFSRNFHPYSPVHPLSPIFIYVHLSCSFFVHMPTSLHVFTFSLVFQRNYIFSHLHVFFVFAYFHLYPPTYSPIFTYFHLFSPIFTYFHLFSPIFTNFHLF